MKNLIYLIFFSTLVFSSCEELPVDIPIFVPPETEKVVLIEEYTGVRCVNCPGGAREISNLQSLYGENLIAVSVHTGFFSAPYPESLYDFRTPEGDNVESYVGQVLGYPAASVDRKTFSSLGVNDPILDRARWASAISEELDLDPEVFLVIDHIYDEGTREVTATVKVTPIEDIERDLRVGLMITESGIADYQLDTDGKHSDYIHNHALRAYLTDIKGEKLNGPLNAGETYSKTYKYTLPAENGWWVDDNCNLVAFVGGGPDDDKVLIQAAEEHLK